MTITVICPRCSHEKTFRRVKAKTLKLKEFPWGMYTCHKCLYPTQEAV